MQSNSMPSHSQKMPRQPTGTFFIKKINMKYELIKENGERIEATPERWVWGILYKDDSELHQFGDDGIFHQIKDIEQDRIKMAVLYKFTDFEQKIYIPWREGMKLIHKYINVHAGAQHENMSQTARVYVFGYKLGNQTHYTYILPNDQKIYSPEENIDLTLFKLI